MSRLGRFAAAAFVLIGLCGSPASAWAEASSCQLRLGFADLASQIKMTSGVDRVGPCLQDASYAADGDASQATTGGLLVWRKGPNWTGFTDGGHTWINSRYGLLERSNTERFRWESDAQHAGDPLDRLDLTRAYLQASDRVQHETASAAVTTLTPIREDNPRLHWKAASGGDEVLMATWTSWPGYNGLVGQATTTGVETWVTAVPEVHDFCASQILIEPELRLEELLGLPPGNGKQFVVELWVHPADMFRPSADPDITTTTSGLDFPATVSPDYVTWFNTTRAALYGPHGYPWTRLGYTYDWANPAKPVGLSEFVIRKAAPVEVNSASTNAQYCP